MAMVRMTASVTTMLVMVNHMMPSSVLMVPV